MRGCPQRHTPATANRTLATPWRGPAARGVGDTVCTLQAAAVAGDATVVRYMCARELPAERGVNPQASAGARNNAAVAKTAGNGHTVWGGPCASYPRSVVSICSWCSQSVDGAATSVEAAVSAREVHNNVFFAQHVGVA